MNTTESEKRLREAQEKFLQEVRDIVHDMMREAIAGALSTFKSAPLPTPPKRRGRPPKVKHAPHDVS
jgi:hypothetical protein